MNRAGNFFKIILNLFTANIKIFNINQYFPLFINLSQTIIFCKKRNVILKLNKLLEFLFIGMFEDLKLAKVCPLSLYFDSLP